MIPPMLRRHCLFVLSLLTLAVVTACQERVTVTPEEQHLLERLSRDPSLVIIAYERDDDKRLKVTTRQGNVIAHYLFTPDVAGEKALNVHRIGDASRLDEGKGEPLAPLRVR